MKIVINIDYGGFHLSKEAYEEMGIEWDGYGNLRNKDLGIKSDNYLAYRIDERLIKCIEKLGEKSFGRFANLAIVEIPADVKDWRIEEYDGIEHIAEGRIWKE